MHHLYSTFRLNAPPTQDVKKYAYAMKDAEQAVKAAHEVCKREHGDSGFRLSKAASSSSVKPRDAMTSVRGETDLSLDLRLEARSVTRTTSNTELSQSFLCLDDPWVDENDLDGPNSLTRRIGLDQRLHNHRPVGTDGGGDATSRRKQVTVYANVRDSKKRPNHMMAYRRNICAKDTPLFVLAP